MSCGVRVDVLRPTLFTAVGALDEVLTPEGVDLRGHDNFSVMVNFGVAGGAPGGNVFVAYSDSPGSNPVTKVWSQNVLLGAVGAGAQGVYSLPVTHLYYRLVVTAAGAGRFMASATAE